ncbi:hypothetical protein N6H14_16285 [Paenibacillus sp. CC-CFT747]|nr:hypothetical protein N6H14_16285 [Paenibacillus sp. CC-CFT747]
MLWTLLSIDEEDYCTDCHRELDKLFRINGKSLSMHGDVLTKTAEESIHCKVCQRTVVEGQEYFIVSVPEDKLEELADLISADIGGCEHCEGNERAHFVHIFNDDPHDTSSRMSLDDALSGMSVSEYLYDKGVPEEHIERFAWLIKCGCGYGRENEHSSHNPDGGIFTLEDYLYTRKDIGNFWGFDVENFLSFAQQYGIDLSFEDMFNFREHLLAYPMLAYQHETGIKIYQALKALFEAGMFVTVPINTTMFRGRTRKKDMTRPYTQDELWAPPIGKPQHGRYNTIGVPVLYVTDSDTALPYEVHPSPDELIDVVEFQ